MVATVVIGLAVLGCGDPAYSSIVVNDSEARLIVRYTPTDPDLHVLAFSVEPHKGGHALAGGAGFGGWRGGSIDVLTIDCRSLGRISLDDDTSAVHVSPTLVVSRLGLDKLSDEARMTFLPEISNTTCEIPAASSTAGSAETSRGRIQHRRRQQMNGSWWFLSEDWN